MWVDIILYDNTGHSLATPVTEELCNISSSFNENVR